MMATTTFDAVQSFEPVTQAQIRMIGTHLGPIQSMVVRLGEVDISRGAGIVSKRAKCLWTKDGRRITFEILPGGGFMAGISEKPDPAAPTAK